MAQNLILVAIVLFLCLMAEKLSGKVGMPALILFMGVGMLFGSDGILRIAFDDYGLAQNICLIALCFIMFYGGFNMKWSAARPVAVKAICLSTIGVVVTAGLTAVFCLVVLKFDFVDAFLMGAVLSSTDAASVFSVLRTKKLNLKDGTASILEMESGSNRYHDENRRKSQLPALYDFCPGGVRPGYRRSGCFPWHSFTEEGNDAGSRHGYDPCDRPGDDCLRFI